MVPEPRTPYAKSKTLVRDLLRQARQEQGVFAASAILYNHESPLRGPGFVTRKISMSVARIAAGQESRLELGDIEVARDWGWAPDYVRGMQLMLSADQPRDYILATGISHRLSFFVAKAFAAAGIKDWRKYVTSTSDNSRPVDSNLLVGDSQAAYRDLGWRHTVDFDSMAAAMVNYDIALLKDPTLLWMDF
jgi:GDPmannose 4,6-dehydratase